MYNQRMNQRQALSNDDLRLLAPSIFAANPMNGVSNRYSFVSTIDVVEGMRSAGWMPMHVKENRVRKVEKMGFQKHLIRFQNPGQAQAMKVGDSVFELALINSHDRSSGYNLNAGVFRMICLNGMMVADCTVGKIGVHHVGLDVNEVIRASLEIAGQVPAIQNSVAGMQARRLTDIERVAFAEAAILLNHDTVKESPVTPQQMLTPRRHQDGAPTLWATFNTVQENVIKGGQRGTTTTAEGRSKRVRTREVKSISEDIRLNKALWHLAEALGKGMNPVEVVQA